jgi:DNA repair exonuclease SbcCD ATPase subunit
MKEIILRRLALLNFKGIRKLEINFDEHETNIYGANGSGKTTIFDAFRWLLFGKDGNDRKDFNIKTLDKSGRVIERLPHEVEAVIEVAGEEITLKKCFTEKWQKKRGSAVETFNGHMVECFYNEVPCSVSEYERKIAVICDEQVFKLITNPLYFTAQRKDFQRGMLISMVGEISIDDIVADNPELADLVAALSGKTLEEYKREIANKKRRIKEAVDMIPARIDERKREIPDETDWSALEAEIAVHQSRIDELDKQIADRSRAYNEITKERQELARRLSERKSSLTAREYELKDKLLADYNNAKRAHDTAVQNEVQLRNERRIRALSLPRLESEVAQLTDQKENVLKPEFRAICTEVFITPDPDSFICPMCRRPLETSDVEAETEKLRKAFEADKAARKNRNKARGQELAAQIAAKEEEISAIKNALFELDTHIGEIQSSSVFKTEPTIPDITPALDSDVKLKSLREEIAAIQRDLDVPVTVPMVSDLHEEKKVEQDKINAIRYRLRDRELIENNNRRISELEKELKESQNELTRLEGIEFSIQQFGKARIEQVESRINGLFKIVRFKMYEQQINGGEIETCEATVDGVPFSDLNSAAKINAGLDIINAISLANGIVAPIYIDNRESVTDIVSTNAQIINLVVAPDCHTLKID